MGGGFVGGYGAYIGHEAPMPIFLRASNPFKASKPEKLESSKL